MAALLFAAHTKAENWAYTGTIYTWEAGANNSFHQGSLYATTLNEDGSFTLQETATGQWNRDFCAASSVGGNDTSLDTANTLRFADSGAYAVVNYSFTPLTIGGLIVSADSTVSQMSGGNRPIRFGNSSDTIAYTSIESDFTLSGGTSTTYLRGTQQWSVAEGASFILSSPSLVQRSLTLSGSGTVAFGRALTVDSGAQLQLSSEGELQLGQTLVNNGTLNLAGRVNLAESLAAPVLAPPPAGTNGFATRDALNVTVISGSGSVNGLDSVTWLLQGSELAPTDYSYVDGVLEIAAGNSPIYYIQENDSSVIRSADSLRSASGFAVSASGTTLTLESVNSHDLSNGVAYSGSGTNTLGIGAGSDLTDRDISRTGGGVLNATVQGKFSLNTSDIPLINGNLSIGAGGQVMVVAQDAFGYRGGGDYMDSVTLEGQAGAPAELLINMRQTMTTPIELKGYSRIADTPNAVSSGNQIAGLEAYGYSVTAQGTANEIATRLLGRGGENVEINVVGADDQLNISGVMLHRPSETDSNYIKTGAGTLELSADGNSFDLPYQHRSGTTLITGQSLFNQGFSIDSGTFRIAAQAEVTSVIGINTDGELVVDGLLLLGGDSSVGSLSGSGTLSAVDSALTLNSSSVIGAVQAASVSMDGADGARDLTLTSSSENSFVDALFGVETLTVGPSASLAVSGELSAEQLHLQVDTLTPLLTAATLSPIAGSSLIEVDASASDALLLGLSNGSSLTLASFDTVNADLVLTVNGSREYSLTNDSGFTYKYTLEENTEGGIALRLTATRDALGWVGEELSVWRDGSTAEWVGEPPSAMAPARFFGDGVSDVRVDAGGVTARQVLVSADGATTSYTFSGGDINTTALAVSAGSLNIGNKLIVRRDLAISPDSGMVVVGNEGSLQILSNGELLAEGELQVQGRGVLRNAGSLTAASIQASGTVIENTGRITVGKGNVGGISGGELLIDTVGDTPAGMLVLASDTSLELLGGSGALSAAAATLHLEHASGSVDVEAAALELGSNGSSLGDVRTGRLSFAGSMSLDGGEVPLSVTSLSPLTDKVDVVLSDSVFDTLPVQAVSGRYIPGDYPLIRGVSSSDALQLDAAAQLQQVFRYGLSAEALADNDYYTLRISELASPLSWDASGGNRVTSNGYIVPETVGFYKALDYVERVSVSDSQSFDLSLPEVGNAVAGNATIPAAGLFVRNLSGGGELAFIGDGKDLDTVTLINTETSAADAPVALSADALLLQAGLPESVQGILPGDHSRVPMRFRSVSLQNLAQFSIAENQPVSTARLDGQQYTLLSGTLEIDGREGVYLGGYENAVVRTLPGSSQTLASGSGLSLEALGGHTTLVYSTDSPAPVLQRLQAQQAELTLDNMAWEADGTPVTQSLTLDSPSSVSGSLLQVSLGVDESAAALGTPAAPTLLQGPLTFSDSTIRVSMVGDGNNGVLPVRTASGVQGVLLATLVEGGNVSGSSVELTGSVAMMATLQKYYTNPRLTPDGDILVDRVTDYYSARFAPISNYGRQGLSMADNALLQLNPQNDASQYPALSAVLDALDTYVVAGDSAAANHLASSLVGASAAAMSAAIAGDMERQLRAIRNRTTSMGGNPDPCRGSYGELPAFHAWVNAEGDHRYLSADGEHPGYSISSWGATLGVESELTPCFTTGLAFSYMHGDFEAKSAEAADGNTDFYYVSAFGRYSIRRWSHTLVGSFGWADAELSRRLPIDGGGISSGGQTNALSYGVLYELGYSIPLDEQGDTILQPLVNVLFSHTSMDGFDERGSDISLHYGDSDMTGVIFGLGARVQGNVGETLNERTARAEARALLKLRAGDRSASVTSSFVELPSVSAHTRSAEPGVVGAEFGAGIIVPLGVDSGALFMDASFEFSGDYTEVNGVIGYRLDF